MTSSWQGKDRSHKSRKTRGAQSRSCEVAPAGWTERFFRASLVRLSAGALPALLQRGFSRCSEPAGRHFAAVEARVHGRFAGVRHLLLAMGCGWRWSCPCCGQVRGRWLGKTRTSWCCTTAEVMGAHAVQPLAALDQHGCGLCDAASQVGAPI